MKKIVIDSSVKTTLDIRELWSYRDLFLVLAYRDYRVKYAQTLLGFFWAFLQPLATLLIFVLIFGQALNVDTGGIPYPIFALCGMSCWTYFAYLMSQSGNSIIAAQNMIKKIYFPRLVIPLSKAVVGFIDYSIVLVFLFVMMLYYGFSPGANLLYAPFFIVITIISALGVGIWLSALTVRFRDFQHVVPFMVQFGLYASPVAFPSELIIRRFPEWLSFLYYLNPMAGVIEGFRWSIVGGQAPHPFAYASFIMVFLLFLSSIYYFKRTERTMADIV